MSKPARGGEARGDGEYGKRQPLPSPQRPGHHPAAQILGRLHGSAPAWTLRAVFALPVQLLIEILCLQKTKK